MITRAVKLAGVAFATLGVQPIIAQTAPTPSAPEANSDTSNDIIVTAERRETSVQRTPISVQAFSTRRLDAQGLRSIDDIARLTPGFALQRPSGTPTGSGNDQQTTIAIRGIDSNAGSATTGVYIDDTPIQSRHLSFATVNAFPSLFDLQRVEVLRGPQGTLFGAGAEGGAVRFILSEPGLHDYTGYFRGEGAFTERGAPTYEVAGAIGGPIVRDRIGFRLSASYRRDGGYVDRVRYSVVDPTDDRSIAFAGNAEKNTNWQNVFTLRGALTIAATDALKITPSIFYQRLKLNDTAVFWGPLSDFGKGQFRSGNAAPSSSKDSFYVASLAATWDVGPVSIVSNTSYFHRDQRSSSDLTAFFNSLIRDSFGDTSLPIYPVDSDRGTVRTGDSQRTFTQELRVQSADPSARFTWVVGGFFTDAHERTSEFDSSNAFVNFGNQTIGTPFQLFAEPVDPSAVYQTNLFRAVDRQIAGFAQGNYKIAAKLTATAGARIASIRTSGRDSVDGAIVQGFPAIADATQTETPVTPKFGLNYQIDRDKLIFASVAKGYRPGGINPQFGRSICGLTGDLAQLGLTDNPERYRSDSLWSYELGAKTTFADGKLRLNASAYHIDWKNIQQVVSLPNCGQLYYDNLGSATSEGFDASIEITPIRNVRLSADIGYTDVRYDRTVFATPAAALDPTLKPIVSAGDKLNESPWTVNLSADADLTPLGAFTPYLHADYQYTGRQVGFTSYLNGANGSSDPGLPRVGSYGNILLRIGARGRGGDISLFVNNLADTRAIRGTSRQTASSTYFLYRTVRPRTFGLTTTYRF